MRKIIYIMSVFFLLFFPSCSFTLKEIAKENISVTLPVWPPEDSCKKMYPEISRWKITTRAGGRSSVIFYDLKNSVSQNGINVEQNQINLKSEKNMPLVILAEPITKTETGKESLFFKPAGFIYPYDKKTRQLSWAHGFIASIMESLFITGETQNLTNIQINNFIAGFNWSKASEIIEEKVKNDSELYNPWLLDRENILNKITEKNFSSIYLNLSSVYTVSPLDINQNNLLCSFVTYNNQQNKNLLLKKEQPQQFLSSPSNILTITCYSAKKVSLESQFLPIYIGGYETN